MTTVSTYIICSNKLYIKVVPTIKSNRKTGLFLIHIQNIVPFAYSLNSRLDGEKLELRDHQETTKDSFVVGLDCLQ